MRCRDQKWFIYDLFSCEYVIFFTNYPPRCLWLVSCMYTARLAFLEYRIQKFCVLHLCRNVCLSSIDFTPCPTSHQSQSVTRSVTYLPPLPLSLVRVPHNFPDQFSRRGNFSFFHCHATSLQCAPICHLLENLDFQNRRCRCQVRVGAAHTDRTTSASERPPSRGLVPFLP
jgi:hypothetical protein